MRYIFFILSTLLFSTIACKKNKSTAFITGTYQGTFQRSIVNKVSNVTLKFSSNNFEGQSQFVHYPDICNGSFSIDRDSISFVNGCVFTADFDWSYILSGKFIFSVSGDSLIISRSYNGGVDFYDTYKLKKQ